MKDTIITFPKSYDCTCNTTDRVLSYLTGKPVCGACRTDHNNMMTAVPKGYRCYGWKEGGFIRSGFLDCLFWRLDSNHRKYENGYCSLLEKGDWDFNHDDSFLWDKYKECGIKIPNVNVTQDEKDEFLRHQIRMRSINRNC